MSTRGPMQVSPSGLVFYYDTFNPKSYKGKPTTNLLTYTNFGNNSNNWYTYCGNGNGITNNTTEVLAPDGTYTATKVVRGTSGACDWTYNGWGLLFSDGTNIFTSGQTYTVSIWARCDTGTMSFILGLNDSHSSGFTITTNWQRITFTATATGLDRGLQFITYDTSGRTYYVWGPQSELGTYATQYTPSGASRGTRTVTNGLVDLNENYTTDLTNAAFDSNANMYLSGGKAVKIVSNSSLFSNTFTWSAWHYIIADGGTGYAGIFWAEGAVGGGSGYQYLLSYRSLGSNAYAHYRINNATTGWGNTDTGTLASSMLNRWIYTTWTFNNGTTKIYINGVLSHTDTSRGAYNGGSDSPVYIGARNDLWGSINGYIQQASYHNRALSDSEVLRNFNATKSRFGL